MERSFELDVYPNPGTEFINVRLMLTEGSEARTEITDLTGKMLKTERIQVFGNIRIRIGTSDHCTGIYTVRLTTDSSVGTETFVVN